MKETEKFIVLHQSLMALNHQEGFIDRNRLQKLHAIVKNCAHSLGVARASIWLLNEERTRISCEVLFNAVDQTFEEAPSLDESDFPHYFNAIKKDRLINADNALTDSRTCEFRGGYLEPLNIYAMLDAPIFSKGKLSGVLCLEQTGAPRQWDVAEMSYAAAAADTISLIDEHERWLQAREQLAIYERCDALTGLENRFYFQQRLDRELKTRGLEPAALVMLGLDGFTGVNDYYGHQVANEVLFQLTERLHVLATRFKCVPARVGGDQFALWMPQVDQDDSVDQLIVAIQDAMLIPFCIKGIVLSMTVGIGAVVSSVNNKVDNVFRCAEVAMFKAKHQGRGMVEYFSFDYLSEMSERLSLERELLYALEHEQLCVFYQPIVDSIHHRCVGLEALVRWNHPTKGFLTPIVFLALAAEMGLMPRLGEIVIRQVCRDIKVLQADGLLVSWVAINLSAEQLHSVDFVRYLSQQLAYFNLPAGCLELEIVEDQIAHESKLVQAQLEALSALNVSMSIDDFGTGHSSLYRLKHLPVSKLKIDKSFVDGLPNQEEDRCIASAIIGLAKGMGLGLVAEGVETQEQATWLAEQGCEYLQGYFFSTPVPFASVKKLLSRQFDQALSLPVS